MAIFNNRVTKVENQNGILNKVTWIYGQQLEVSLSTISKNHGENIEYSEEINKMQMSQAFTSRSCQLKMYKSAHFRTPLKIYRNESVAKLCFSQASEFLQNDFLNQTNLKCLAFKFVRF